MTCCLAPQRTSSSPCARVPIRSRSMGSRYLGRRSFLGIQLSRRDWSLCARPLPSHIHSAVPRQHLQRQGMSIILKVARIRPPCRAIRLSTRHAWSLCGGAVAQRQCLSDERSDTFLLSLALVMRMICVLSRLI